MAKKKSPALCPCGGNLPYEACCGRFHAGELAPDAVALMKSRYSAFVKKDAAYLTRTWCEETCEHPLELTDAIKWTGLTIVDSESTGDEATVTFIARGKVNGRAFKHEEKSRFVKRAGAWAYLDGEVRE